MLPHLAVLFACATCLEAASKTIQANLVYRHGDRSPIATFPKDVNLPSAWPQGYGQLSEVGMMQHFELGGLLKMRYSQLLSSDYVRTEISVRSTDIDRALMSAYSNLAGLYPPGGSQTWNARILWQPIPVHTVPTDSDILLGQASCVRYDDLMKASKDSPEVVNVTSHYEAFFQALAELSGSTVHDLFSLRSLFDTLFCEMQHNLVLPPWLSWTNITGDNRTSYDVLRELSDFTFKISYDSREKQRLTAGTLVGQMCQNMDAAAAGANNSTIPRMFVYSAHDTTVASLLSALNVYDNKQPSYTATVMVELQREDDGQLTVAIYYKNGVNSTIVPLSIPGCADPCPLTIFKALTADVVPGDWNNECRNRAPLLTQTEIIVISVCACITLCLAMATIILYARRKDATSGYEEIPTNYGKDHP